MLFGKSLRIGILATLMLTSMIVIVTPQPAEAGLLTIVQADINEGYLEVDVSPGSTGSVTFTGTIEVTNYNSATPLIVSLMATIGLGTATVAPPSMVFQGGKTSDNFQIVCVIPLLSPFQPTTITVSGTWQQGGIVNNIQPATATLMISQFQRMTVFSELPVIQVGPGRQAVFNLRIENTGNFEDEVRIEVPNIDDLSDKGFIIPLLPKSQVLVGEPKIFTLPVTLPHDWVLWTDHPETIWIKVTSTSDETYSEEYPLIIRVRGIYIPGFEPVFAIMCIAFLAVALKRRHDRSG